MSKSDYDPTPWLLKLLYRDGVDLPRFGPPPRQISFEERCADDAMDALGGKPFFESAAHADELSRALWEKCRRHFDPPTVGEAPPPQEQIEVSCPTCRRSFGTFTLKARGLLEGGYVEITPVCQGCISEGR